MVRGRKIRWWAFPGIVVPCAAALLQIGCPAPPPPPPIPTLAVPPPSAAGAPVPSASAEAKAPFLPERRDAAYLEPWSSPARTVIAAACKVVDKAQADASKRDASPPEDNPYRTPGAPECIPAAGGAWGLLQTVTGYDRNALNAVMQPACGSEADGGPCLYDAEISIVPVHVDAKGARASGAAIQARTFVDGGIGGSAKVFDFDGDGKDELILPFVSTILTFKGGKVTPYAPASGVSFTAVVDADRDGRPDLLLENPYAAGTTFFGCGKWYGHPLLDFQVETSLVAHALRDGTFTLDDDVTRGVAKTLCPEKPASIVVKDGAGKFHNGWIRDDVVCARLWGSMADVVVGELERDCKWPAEEDECAALFGARDNLVTDVCAGHDELVRWAKVTPPLALSATRSQENRDHGRD